MKIYKWVPVLFFITSNAFAATYTGTKPKDLDLTTPPEGTTKVSEFNNSDREIKTVILNMCKITAITGTYTASGTETVIIGSNTASYLLSFPTATSVATGTITKEYTVINRNTGTITINLTVDGVGSPTVTGSQTFKLFTDGTSWFEERANTAAIASNAQLLDNLDSTHFTNATNLSTGTVNLDRIPGTLTGKDADTIDGYHAGTSASRVLVLDSSALVPLANIPSTLTGKDADTVDGINGASIVKTTDDYVSRISITGSGVFVSGNTGAITISNTGVTGLLAGAGISLSNGGIGTVTVTASGTASAGGWTESGTQITGNAGLEIVPQGTIAVHASYGITGLLDAWIPNTITLDNLTQVTTRNFSAMQGAASDAQVDSNITLDNVTQITTRNLSDMQGQIVNSQMPSKNPYGTLTVISTNATTTSSTIMPITSIPTITDGVEVVTTSYAASTSTARLDIEAVLQVGATDISKHIIAGLYVNNGTNAVTAGGLVTGQAVVSAGTLVLHYNFLPGTTTAQDYDIRLGPGTNTGGAPVVALNSYAYGGSILPLFGSGGCASTVRFIEYIP